MARAAITLAIKAALAAGGFASEPHSGPGARERFRSRQQLPAAWIESTVEEREDISTTSRIGRITYRIVVLLKAPGTFADDVRNIAETGIAAALAVHRPLQDAVLTAEIASVESADPPGGAGGKQPYARVHVDYVATYAFPRRSAA